MNGVMNVAGYVYATEVVMIKRDVTYQSLDARITKLVQIKFRS